MAALAYVLLPVSGMLAYLSWAGPRVRFHGAQAVIFGLVWSLALYACSAVSATATQITFILGAITWLALMVATAAGRDLHLPVVGKVCARAVDFEEVG